MKRKKIIFRNCRRCLHHTDQKVTLVRKAQPSELKKGQRRYRASTKGHKGFTRPKRSSSRKIKKQNLLYECSVCHFKAHNKGIIAKNIEIK